MSQSSATGAALVYLHEMKRSDWDERYRSGETPWDTGVVDAHLVEHVSSGRVTPGRALEVGCGTGTNARWLAEQGFGVVAVDLTALAIEKAKSAPAPARGSVEFHCLDFLKDEVPGGPFDFVFDRGCFHVFDDASDRARFAERIAAVLGTQGTWLSLIGSTEGPDRDVGPPRRSARDIASAIEPALAIVELRTTLFHHYAAAWLSVAQRRELPAQPSTRRE